MAIGLVFTLKMKNHPCFFFSSIKNRTLTPAYVNEQRSSFVFVYPSVCPSIHIALFDIRLMVENTLHPLPGALCKKKKRIPTIVIWGHFFLLAHQYTKYQENHVQGLIFMAQCNIFCGPLSGRISDRLNC